MDEHHHIVHRLPSKLEGCGLMFGFSNGLQMDSMRGNPGWGRPARCVIKQAYTTCFTSLFFTVQPATHLLRPGQHHRWCSIMPPPLSAHHIMHYIDQIDCHIMHDINCCVTHDFNHHTHGPPHPTLTAASHHFNCTPLWMPHMSQLDCNRNPTTSPLPSLRDVGACNHNQQALSARSNEWGDWGQTKWRVRRRRACTGLATNARQSSSHMPPHWCCPILLHCCSSEKREVWLWQGSVHPTHHPVYVSCSPTSSMGSVYCPHHLVPLFSFLQHHLQCQCNDTCPTSFTDWHELSRWMSPSPCCWCC